METDGKQSKVWVQVVCLTLIVTCVIGIYGRSVGFDFINYDDPAYVYENEMVSKGVTGESIVCSLS